MKKITLTITALAMSAMVFTGCSSGGNDDEDNTQSGISSSIEGVSSSLSSSSINNPALSSFETVSSSSIGQVSSSSIYYDSLEYEGNTYKTVKIGEQVWMKENLNVVPNGNNNAAINSWCNEDKPGNCVRYGRLYDWATAMALPEECNTEECAGIIETPHQGLCPEGYHIPTNDDWDKLYKYVDTDNGYESSDTIPYYGSYRAGRYLKDKFSWGDCGPADLVGKFSVCEDTYGFSALSGGLRYAGGTYNNYGSNGRWWSSNESDSTEAYDRNMSGIYENAGWNTGTKIIGISVRCIKD